MAEENLKIIKKDLDSKFPAKTGSGYTPPEQPQPPKEHLLHVYMGGAQLLLPNTSEYKEYDGLETGALALCTGIALYIPQGSEAILGIGHLAPSQNTLSLLDEFRKQLTEAGINFSNFRQQQGFIELIPGQTTYDAGKSYSRGQISEINRRLREQFPKLRSFPSNSVSYSVLRGHLSSSVKLIKNGRLVILGEGKAY